tara:strand:- start:155 stop:394 length:240 start_codon:yes stop_codon:yes gene_type:complete
MALTRQVDGVKVDISDEEEKEILAARTEAKKRIEAKAYVRKRQKSYPSVGDQLEALWKGGDDQAAMKVLVDKVKTDNPK